MVLMDDIFTCVLLAVLGLMFGSFSGATVWRLRARQLVEDKASGEAVDNQEYEKLLPLTRDGITKDRSRCLHCGHTLAWYDLIPLLSWVSTGGKCRYCGIPIGLLEPLIELGVAAFFVGSYLLWPEPLQTPLAITHFVVWLVSGVLLAILFTYDFKWFLLPDYIVFPLIASSAVIATIHVLAAPDIQSAIISLVGAVAILSGIYFALWLISKGQWIGFGDVKLGLALALLLGEWQLAFVALFSANLIGCVLVIPGMLSGRMTRTSRVPFGPLLIAGTLVAALVGQTIITWYVQALL